MPPPNRPAWPAALTAAILIGVMSVEPIAQAERTRTVFFDTFPISEKLRSDDEVVLVRMEADAVAVNRTLTGAEALREAVGSPEVTTATVNVLDVSGETTADGSWVHTVFRGAVSTVHRVGSGVPSQDRVLVGQQLEFSVSGGETRIGRVVVRAGTVVPFPKKGKYLVFLTTRDPQGRWRIVHSVPLLVQGQRLTAVAPSTSAISGLSLRDLRQAARR